MIDTILHYKIIEKLGEGGMGIVYLAEDTRLDRKVAIKFLPRQIAANEEERERFKIEAKAAAALNHPNIATIHAIEEHDDEIFIVMEYIEGQELRDIVGATGRSPLPVNTIINYAVQIAEGLQAAHKKGVIHRDIKSTNIMVIPHGRDQAKIMDFGLAKIGAGSHLTKEHSTLGTVAYMSPEQCMGGKIDLRSDIWSFGVVLYEILAGHLPFEADVEQVVIYMILNEPPKAFSREDFPPALGNILNKALSKDPDDRYQNMEELLQDLMPLKESGIRELRTDSTQGFRPKKVNKKKWPLSAAAIAVLIALLGIFYQFNFKRRAELTASPLKSIAVMYFDNRSREPDLDEILVDMLTTNLARNQNLEVLSSQRLFDISKTFNQSDEKLIDRHVATEIANHAGVNTMLLGSIIQIGDKIRINSQLADVKTGSIIGSELVEGEKIEDIFSMVDELTAKLSINLGLISIEAEGQILRVEDVTTNSFEAYKYYQRGREYTWRRELDKATGSFKQAIAIDSTFAMAYLYMAREANNTVDQLFDLSQVQHILQKAEKHAADATEKERLLIRAYRYFYERDFVKSDSLFQKFVSLYPRELDSWHIVAARYLGKADEAIRMLERQLEVDPTFAPLYNELGYCYSQKGDHDNAISAIKKYIALMPDIANGYDSAWDIYTHAGRYQDALQIVETALQRNPEWGWELYLLVGHSYLFMGQPDLAREKILKTLEVDPTLRGWVRKNIGFSYIYEGRYHLAVAEFNKAVEFDLADGNNIEVLRTYMELAKLQAAMGNFDDSLNMIAKAREFSKIVYDNPTNPARILTDYITGRTLILKGDYAEAKATAEAIRKFIVDTGYDVYYLHYYHLLRAEFAIMHNDGEQALSELDKAPAMVHYYPRHHVLLARAYECKGEIQQAIDTYARFRDLIDTQLYFMGGDAFDYFLERSKIDYELARLYQQNGNNTSAISYYSGFLQQWRNADQQIADINEAKLSLAKLESGAR